MRHHPFRLAALVVALAALGTTLSAQAPEAGPGRGRGPMRGGPMQGHGFKGLNLTTDQQAKVKAIHESHQAAFKAKGDAAQAAHKALFEGLANAATDTAALKALHDRASAAQFDLLLERRAVRQEVLPLLTAEQKAQFEKHPGGMGPRGPRPGGPAPHGPGMGMGMGMGMGSGMGTGRPF